MASAHLSARAQPISRSRGESSTAAAAYRGRCVVVDQRTGQVHDYSSKASDVLFQGMYAPKGAPEWAQDRAEFWNAVEAREGRKDSQLAREFNIALPHELSIEQNRWLIQDWAKENFTRRGYVADVVIHAPHSWSDERNVHAHVMVPLRKFDGPEWGHDKDRFINGEPDRAELMRLRESWEKLANRHLQRHGHEARIDMRSFAEQGIDQKPEIHLGKAAAGQERRGVDTERGDMLRDIQRENLEKQLARTYDHKVTVQELHREPVWKAPEMDSQQVEIQSAIDRKRAEEREEDRRQGFTRNEGHRGVVAAIWRLTQTVGGTLAEIILGADRAALLMGRRIEAPPRPQIVVDLEPAAQERRTPKQPPIDRTISRPSERFQAITEAIEQRQTVPQAHPQPHIPARDLGRVQGLIDALGVAPIVAQEDIERERDGGDSGGQSQAPAAVQTQDVVHDRDAGETTSRKQRPAAAIVPATPQRAETYAEELRRKARERGQELRDMVPMPERENDLDQEWDLEL